MCVDSAVELPTCLDEGSLDRVIVPTSRARSPDRDPAHADLRALSELGLVRELLHIIPCLRLHTRTR